MVHKPGEAADRQQLVLLLKGHLHGLSPEVLTNELVCGDDDSEQQQETHKSAACSRPPERSASRLDRKPLPLGALVGLVLLSGVCTACLTWSARNSRESASAPRAAAAVPSSRALEYTGLHSCSTGACQRAGQTFWRWCVIAWQHSRSQLGQSSNTIVPASRGSAGQAPHRARQCQSQPSRCPARSCPGRPRCVQAHVS